MNCSEYDIAATVQNVNSTYYPELVTIGVNQVVEFNLRYLEELQTATEGPQGCPGAWSVDGTGCVRFLLPGQYAFHSENHVNMTGKVVVTP